MIQLLHILKMHMKPEI